MQTLVFSVVAGLITEVLTYCSPFITLHDGLNIAEYEAYRLMTLIIGAYLGEGKVLSSFMAILSLMVTCYVISTVGGFTCVG